MAVKWRFETSFRKVAVPEFPARMKFGRSVYRPLSKTVPRICLKYFIRLASTARDHSLRIGSNPRMKDYARSSNNTHSGFEVPRQRPSIAKTQRRNRDSRFA